MKILVAVSSKHGSTREIAQAIAEELGTAGHVANVMPCEDAKLVPEYDAVIVGSAVYMGSWLPAASDFVENNAKELQTRPVWLFSSGPIGRENPKPTGDPSHLDSLRATSAARGHRIFVGKLDKADLTLPERLIVKMIGAPEGDFRDWDAIRGWGRDISSELAALPVPAG